MLVGKEDASYDIALDFTSQLPEIAPVLYATGNHEQRMRENSEIYQVSYADYRQQLKDRGILFLENESCRIEAGTVLLEISGVELPSESYKKLKKLPIQTSDIAEIIISSKWEKMEENLDKLTAMATGVSKMVRNSVTAYVEKDLELARTVMKDDDEIDDYFDEIRDQMIQLIREADSRDGRKIFDLIMVTKYLERIGDHTTNIAEWVEFSITGVHKDSSVMHQEGERNI